MTFRKYPFEKMLQARMRGYQNLYDAYFLKEDKENMKKFLQEMKKVERLKTYILTELPYRITGGGKDLTLYGLHGLDEVDIGLDMRDHEQEYLVLCGGPVLDYHCQWLSKQKRTNRSTGKSYDVDVRPKLPDWFLEYIYFGEREEE